MHERTAAEPANRRESAEEAGLRDKLGVGQWFHYEAHADVERALELVNELGVRHLRTGISWADYFREGGPAWYDWMFRQLAGAGLELLVSVWHTPPSLGERPRCSAPPRDLKAYADFIDTVITRYGDCFGDLELWNEPNNRLKWDFVRHDPDWSKFAAMIGMAGHWARRCGMRCVLGGMIPVDPAWLRLMRGHGTLGVVDAVGIHGFPGMWCEAVAPHIEWEWRSHWRGWEHKIAGVRDAAEGLPIWVTETGLATWDLARGCEARFGEQSARLRAAAAAPAERVYWYSLMDLDPKRLAIEQTEGDWIDRDEYHMGLATADGRPKPAFELFAELMREGSGGRRGKRRQFRNECGNVSGDP